MPKKCWRFVGALPSLFCPFVSFSFPQWDWAKQFKTLAKRRFYTKNKGKLTE
jgi:hypothetical protein